MISPKQRTELRSDRNGRNLGSFFPMKFCAVCTGTTQGSL